MFSLGKGGGEKYVNISDGFPNRIVTHRGKLIRNSVLGSLNCCYVSVVAKEFYTLLFKEISQNRIEPIAIRMKHDFL